MPSVESRSKLKAFQFIEGRPSAPPAVADEKENASQARSQPHQNCDDSNRITPATPATRLPLADLIGNVDEAGHRPVQEDGSPEDQLHWMPNSSYGTTKTPGSQSRKRARSSSPASSQHESLAQLSQERQNGYDGHIKQTLRTPQADPVAELWNRYAPAASSRDNANALPQPAFHHLLDDSSPRSPGIRTSGSKSGLRRWASEGNQWSNHRAKRRRTTTAMYKEQIEDVFADCGAKNLDLTTEKSKPSRIGFLVERMQETLLKQPPVHHNNDEPSSSSPFPERGGLRDDPSQLTSPLQKLAPVMEEYCHTAADAEASLHSPVCNTKTVRASKQSGKPIPADFDREYSTAEAVKATEAVRSHADALELSEHDALQAPSTESSHILGDVCGLEDIFDDLDDEEDMFAVDMEKIASLYDSKPESVQDQAAQLIIVQQNAKVSEGSNSVIKPIAQEREPRQTIVIDDDEDDFGADEIDDEAFVTAELMATQRHEASARNGPSVLLVRQEHTKIHKAITLRQSWYDTPCTPNSFVHVIGDFSHDGQCIIDDARNMLILHPDHLISATVVADSFECTRRAVLQDRIKATSGVSEAQVYGHILHELFQTAMTANRWDTEWLVCAAEAIVSQHLESIYELNLTVQLAVDALKAKISELQAWANLFVRQDTSPEALVRDRSGKQVRMSITKLLDVEEHVWSPRYGLKGNIDATMEVLMNDEKDQRTLTVPFELKTGSDKAGAAHRAQTALYTLLLSDRYDVNVMYGLLYYMEKSEVSRIPAIRHELRHMIMQRNELACYVRNRLELPAMLKGSHKCKNCYAQTACFLYHKLAEDGDGAQSGAKQQFEELVKGLKPIHGEFFKKWDRLLTQEEKEMMKLKRELWTMLSSEREKVGRCFSDVVLESDSVEEQVDSSRINRFKYTFIKRKATPGFSFTESQLAVGEPIVISDEKGHFALANGYVTSIGKRRISVAVDRRLHNARIRQAGFDDETNQVFSGIMEVGQKAGYQKDRQHSANEVVYRLDKDEFSNGMATARNNLIQAMGNGYHARELRALIVEDIPPKFKVHPSNYSLSGPLSQLSLNSDQKAAIEKVMSAEDYALVLGMPGTGKTTTIAHIIRALVAKGKSVLLTSYTHTAVDNILLKIRKDGINVLRLGALAKIHPEVQEFAQLAAVPRKTIEELRAIYTQPQVVATTCLGINHHVFQERIFDYCIVDEASQITLPVCLGPIRMAKTFVLVGDHYQLPPLVQNVEAREGGLDVSLFRLLSERHPESVVSLEHQYRMCEDIMLLSNNLIYNGRLKCGNEAVASRSLLVPNADGLRRFHGTQISLSNQMSICQRGSQESCWVARLLGPMHRVTFANTDPLWPAAQEECKGSRIQNALEARLTTQLIEGFISVGVAASDIGVITFYRSQLALLKQSLRQHSEIEMHTADRFQGRDKEVVVLSCVRSNEAANVGELLRDWRRVNVALTRARSKLVILGSRRTLCGNELLKRFVGSVEERGWRYDLPQDAAEMHGDWSLNSSVTQASPAKANPSQKRAQQNPLESSPLQKKHGKIGSQSLGASPSSTKTIKSPGKNILGKAKPGMTKQPGKTGKIGKISIVGNRPVLRDIVNDALS
ncbi:MAG: Tripartite DNA replication factor [Bathelium mastoideum]|nr:MAG: Tripartite DNA replication factor [Bathelium mastoideum]